MHFFITVNFLRKKRHQHEVSDEQGTHNQGSSKSGTAPQVAAYKGK